MSLDRRPRVLLIPVLLVATTTLIHIFGLLFPPEEILLTREPHILPLNMAVDLWWLAMLYMLLKGRAWAGWTILMLLCWSLALFLGFRLADLSENTPGIFEAGYMLINFLSIPALAYALLEPRSRDWFRRAQESRNAA